SLVFQRLAQFCVTLLDLLKQPNVLDRDNRLRCEGFKELDLLLGERADLHPTDHDRSNRDLLTQQRRGEYRPNAETSGMRRWQVVLGLCFKVMNVNGSPVNYGSARYCTPVDAPRFITFGNRDWPIRHRRPKDTTIRPKDNRIARITEPRRVLRNYIQHRLNVIR